MDLYTHKNRHVVVAESVEGEKAVLRWVGLLPSVQGTARRGRPPSYGKTPVALSELTVLADPSAELLEKAAKVLAKEVEPTGN